MMTMRLEGFYESIVTTFFSVIKGLLFEGKKNPAPFEKSLLVKNNNKSSSFWLIKTILSLSNIRKSKIYLIKLRKNTFTYN